MAGEFAIGTRWDVTRARIRLRKIKGGYGRAVSAAANRTAREMRTDASRRIRKRFAIKKRDLDKHIEIVKASRSRPIARIIFQKTDRPSLKAFGLKQRWGRKRRSRKASGPTGSAASAVTPRRQGKGVSYRIEKGSKRKKIKQAFGADESVWRTLGGHAYKRTGQKRFPIVLLKGLSAWAMMKSPKYNIEPAWKERGRKRFVHHLDDQVRFRLVRAAGKA